MTIIDLPPACLPERHAPYDVNGNNSLPSLIQSILYIFTIVLFPFILPAQTSSRFIHLVDSALSFQVKNDLIPGAVVLIKKGDQIIHKKAYGYAAEYAFDQSRLKNPEVMTTDHVFDIASLTKVVGTTTAIMILHDKGIINVEDPVSHYIPDFNTEDKKSITIRQLLTHSSGLYEWYPMYYRANNKNEVYKLIASLPLNFQIGAGRHYSDLGFTILGQIVENTSNLSLELFDEKNIFIPLGMSHTMYRPLDHHITKIVSTSHGNPYEHRMVYDTSLHFTFKEIKPSQWNHWRDYTLKGEVNDGNAWYACQGISGAAGIFSTANDLQKLVDLLLNKGKANGKQIISEKTIKLFLTKDKFKNGLGWMMDPENPVIRNAPEGSFGHTGFTGTSISVIPKSRVSVILLINRQNKGLLPGKSYYNLSPLRQEIFGWAMKYLN